MVLFLSLVLLRLFNPAVAVVVLLLCCCCIVVVLLYCCGCVVVCCVAVVLLFSYSPHSCSSFSSCCCYCPRGGVPRMHKLRPLLVGAQGYQRFPLFKHVVDVNIALDAVPVLTGLLYLPSFCLPGLFNFIFSKCIQVFKGEMCLQYNVNQNLY